MMEAIIKLKNKPIFFIIGWILIIIANFIRENKIYWLFIVLSVFCFLYSMFPFFSFKDLICFHSWRRETFQGGIIGVNGKVLYEVVCLKCGKHKITGDEELMEKVDNLEAYDQLREKSANK